MSCTRVNTLRELYDAALNAADPEKVLPAYLPKDVYQPVTVIGAGKGSAQMARAFERVWKGPVRGTVVTRYGFGVACRHIDVIEAAHPIPDANGLAAANALLERVEGLSRHDLVIALISGGGSALLPLPPEGFALRDELALNRVLLGSGAPISIMNLLRSRFSAIKGGRLAAAACPARVMTYVISDVPGDDPALVASGPTIPCGTTSEEAAAAIRQFRIGLPRDMERHILSESATAPAQDDERFARNVSHVIASASISLKAAARKAQSLGYHAAILSSTLEGESSEAGKFLASVAREVAGSDRPFSKPVVMLTGGETTVTIRGSGKGGPNTEAALALAVGVDGVGGVSALFADTDGIDGIGDNAGAFVNGDSSGRIRLAGLNPADCLASNDSYLAMSAAGGIFKPGPTGTNVNDFRAILVE